MRRAVAVTAGLVAVLTSAVAPVAPARAAAPVATFGSCGVLQLNGVDALGQPVAAGPQSMAALGDDRVAVLLGGRVFRLLPDGTPDPTFAGRGYTDAAPGEVIAAQTDGSVVVAGRRDGTAVLRRYLPNGAADVNFGG